MSVPAAFRYHDIAVPSGFVHIYLHNIAEHSLLADMYILSPDEISKSKQYSYVTDGERYAQAHIFLRGVLSTYVKQRPAEITFAVHEQGKPSIAGVQDPPLFNLSYRGDQLLVGVSDHPIGVDIELLRDIDGLNEVSKNYYSLSEQQHLQAAKNAKERTERFYRIWTLKEALLKVTGSGVGESMPTLSVLPKGDTDNWYKLNDHMLKELEMPRSYIAAVALKATF